MRLILISLLFAFSAQANDTISVSSQDRQTAVVELYTSEGCSSCPPADKWLKALIDTDKDNINVLALSFHVDYWDYIGWKDRFADPVHTSRQRQLSSNNQQSTIYTPEFFVGGKVTRGTSRVLKTIQSTNRLASPLQLNMIVTKSDNEFLITLKPTENLTSSGDLHHRFFVYEKGLVSNVKRGENTGRTLSHENVVRYMSNARRLDATNLHRISVSPDWALENIGIAAVVTTPGNQSYLQAVHTPVYALLKQ